MKGARMTNIRTNADLRAEIVRQGTTVTAVAKQMGKSRNWLSDRLNFPAKPEQRFIDAVLEAIQEVTK